MRSNVPLKLPDRKRVQLEALEKWASIPKTLKKTGLAFPNDFKAAVVVDSKNSPQYLVFDAKSFWDLVCAFDERYEKNVSTKEYLTHNPVGWLIDAIESSLPLNPKIARKLKRSIRMAEKLGKVPFRNIKEKLGLMN